MKNRSKKKFLYKKVIAFGTFTFALVCVAYLSSEATVDSSQQNSAQKFGIVTTGDPTHGYQQTVSTEHQPINLDDVEQWLKDPIPGAADVIANFKEDEIDVGRAALMLARDFDRSINIEAYSAKIDEMVKVIRGLTNGSKDPEHRLAVINEYLFDIWGMSYDFSDPKTKQVRNQYLNGLLDTKKGTCATMPLLYLAISQRLGYPVYGVVAPHHLFLRYNDPKLKKQNIEATSGGGYIPEDEYQFLTPVSKKGVEMGSYYKTLTHRELFGELIATAAIRWGAEPIQDMRRSIRYLELSLRLRNINPFAHKMLAEAYELLPKMAPAKYHIYFAQKADIHRKIADDLGLSWPEKSDNYVVEDALKIQKYRELKQSLNKKLGVLQ